MASKGKVKPEKRKRDVESDQDQPEDKEKSTGKGGRVPMTEIRAGHLMSKHEYWRVLEVMPESHKMRCEVLRGDKANDVWEITTRDALLGCSSEYVQREEKLSKTELANRLVHCKDDVFKVVFRPVLSAETLAQRLKDLQKEVVEAKTDAALKKVSKKILEVPEKTIVGRLISPNTVLGFSLVDDLDQKDTQKIEYRNVSHANILSLTVAGTRYLLK